MEKFINSLKSMNLNPTDDEVKMFHHAIQALQDAFVLHLIKVEAKKQVKAAANN